MGTTKLIVEFVIAGVVILLAVVFLGMSIFPASAAQVLASFEGSSEWISANWALIAIMLTSISYGLGVVSEYLGLVSFEWLLDLVKQKRMKGFIAANPLILQKSPLLSNYKKGGALDMSRAQISSFYGDMRFHVMMMNAQLYTEIDAYINRFRLIRVLFLAEVIIAISVSIKLIDKFSWQLVALLIFMMILALANYLAVQYQFSHYCRAVERSYKALFLDSLQPTSKKRISKTAAKGENE